MTISIFSGPTVVQSSLGVSSLLVNGVPAGSSVLIGTRQQVAATAISSVTCAAQALAATAAAVTDANTSETFQFWTLDNVLSAGNKTLSVNWAAAVNSDAVFWVLQGCDTNGIYDSAAGTPTNNGAAGSSGSVNIVTTLPNSFIAMFCNSNFGGPLSASGTGYVGTACTGYNNFCAVEHNVDVGAAGTKTPTMTFTGPDFWFVRAVAIRPAVAAPTAAVRQRYMMP